MSDAATHVELVEITVDGRQIQAPKGAMLIEATDREGIDVPRFCYHKKLSVAANCRMCLVEVEKAPKPLPACATPIMPGMVVHTRSKRALDAQRGTMEFLLINHPLDCPICDQGGECELQDQAMGYGAGISQYSEAKRVVFDKYVGPLIATEMTRCIHCTRCVRFGEEIAGLRELGMTGRGEHARIGTFIEKSIVSELSGNVIDLCPVGALTAKPSRYTARAWELMQHASIAPHDSVGSNIYIHSRRGQVVRVVPKENEAVNEVWISDRDRFSYEAIDSSQRLRTPLAKRDGEWRQVSWQEALELALQTLSPLLQASVQADATVARATLGTLVSPIATLEEQYLAQKLVRALGSENIDHRLRQRDFRDQRQAPIMPWSGIALREIDTLGAALLIGANPRKEQPIVAHRLRKASLSGAKISLINARVHPQHFATCANIGVRNDQMLGELMAIAQLLGADLSGLSGVTAAPERDDHKAIAASLAHERSWVLLGSSAARHEDYAALRLLARAIAANSAAVLGYLPEAGNAAGAWLSGCVPHRAVGGVERSSPGLNAAEMLQETLDHYLLLGVDPDLDSQFGIAAVETLTHAKSVIALSHFDTEALRACATLLLPMATFAETSGTFVNAEGAWQSFQGAVPPVGEARPAWKILRVLASQLDLEGFDYKTSTAVRHEVKQDCIDVRLDNMSELDSVIVQPKERSPGMLFPAVDVPLCAVDPLTRRAAALQRTQDAAPAPLSLSRQSAIDLGLEDAQEAVVRNGDRRKTLPLQIDSAVADGCAWIPQGLPMTAALGEMSAQIELYPCAAVEERSGDD